jgi:biopolymer transport protein ExbD
MSIRCQCPHCHAVISIYEKAVGHRIRCPSCQKLIEALPVAAHLPAPPSGTADEPPVPTPLPARGSVESPGQSYDSVEPPPIVSSSGSDAAAVGMVALPNKRKPIIFREKRKAEEAEMDMTPMVDVVFQLLIFFMLTASFTMQKSLNVPKPQQDEASTQSQSVEDFQNNPDYVVVRIDAVNTYHVSTAAWPDEIEAPSEQELLVKLRQARQGDAQGNIPSKLLVIANGEALHERVVTAIDSGNDVGMDEVQLLTVEDDEG